MIKITDFSSATQAVARKHNKFLGKNEYAAPELLLHNITDFKNDSWNIGVIAFEILTGYLPNINLTRNDVSLKVSFHSFSNFFKDS